MGRQKIIEEFNPSNTCCFCKEKGVIKHHVSYFPEVTIRLCQKHHRIVHYHYPELCPENPHDYFWFVNSYDISKERNIDEILQTYHGYREIMLVLSERRGKRTETVINEVKRKLKNDKYVVVIYKEINKIQLTLIILYLKRI